MVNPKNGAQNDVAAISVAGFSRIKLKRLEFLQHSPECENYPATSEATSQPMKLVKNRALTLDQLANSASWRGFYPLAICRTR